MIIVHCGDGSEERYETLDELRRELESSADCEYTDTVIKGLRTSRRVVVPNGPDETDVYEVTDDVE